MNVLESSLTVCYPLRNKKTIPTRKQNSKADTEMSQLESCCHLLLRVSSLPSPLCAVGAPPNSQGLRDGGSGRTTSREMQPLTFLTLHWWLRWLSLLLPLLMTQLCCVEPGFLHLSLPPAPISVWDLCKYLWENQTVQLNSDF